MLPKDRILQFDGAYNFRDIGGLLTRDGCFMKSGILYRSDSLHSLTRGDIRKIQTLNIQSILDLRTPNERKGKNCKVHEHSNIRFESIPIYPLPFREDPSFLKRLAGFLSGKYKGLNLEMIMLECYRQIALENLVEINRIITFLSDESNVPSIIHCQGGKDRTGWLSVLFQSVASVPMEVIYEDYLLSNKFMLRDLKKQKRMVKWFTFFQYDIESVKPLIEAREEYLRSALRLVLDKYITIEGYLEKACGISVKTLHQFKRMLCA
jgi:protein-tyrosine phosphatase